MIWKYGDQKEEVQFERRSSSKAIFKKELDFEKLAIVNRINDDKDKKLRICLASLEDQN